MHLIADYITGITDLTAWLKSIKVMLTDEDIIDVLIFNLHESWGSIAASLTAATEALRLSDVTGALLDEEGRKGGRDPDSGTTALVAKGRNQRIKSTTVTCYRCRKLGHIARHCKEEMEAKADDKAAVAEEFSF
jgi:Zinc knuckle